MSVKELCRKRGFSEASFFLWRSKYGGTDVTDAKRLEQLHIRRRVHWQGDAELGAHPRGRAAAHRAGQAEPECVRGEERQKG